MKKNPPEKYEPINVIIAPDEHPLAYNAMIKSLMNRGMTKAEAVAYRNSHLKTPKSSV